MKKMGCAKCGGTKYSKGGAAPKKMQKGGSMGIVGMPKYGNNPMTAEGRVLQKGGAFAPNRAVKASCKGGKVTDKNGKCVMSRKMAAGGPTDPNKYVMNKTNVFGKYKHKEISKNKFDRVSNRYAKQEGSESLGNNKSISQQVISGRNPEKSVSRVDEARRTELNKKRGVPPMKTGGTTKAKKFAALAPPYNKATVADRIAGAKMRKRK